MDQSKPWEKLPCLEPSFFRGSTEEVAKKLLGKLLLRRTNRKLLVARIVETEAYLGIEDRACHTFGGRRSPRTESMYMEGGHAYIYLIYGIHHCLNVVTQDSTRPEAVLIRAAESALGFPAPADDRLLAGPGKLCRAMKIDRSLDRIRFDSDDLSLRDDGMGVPAASIVAKPRIGIPYAKEAAHWPLRFYIKGHSAVSKF